MNTTRRILAASAVLLALTGCAGNSIATRAIVQKLPDGRSVTCVIGTAGDAVAPSCDWGNAK